MSHSFRIARPFVLVSAAFLALSACRASEETNESGNETGNIIPALPEPDPALDRAGLLGAIRDAASAFSAGTDDSEAQAALGGRRFSVRIPFGCSIDAKDPDAGRQMVLNVREDGRSYQVRARPVIDFERAGFKPAEENGDDAGTEEQDSKSPVPVETVEGFWFHRPWLLADQCPKLAEEADPEAAALTLDPEAPGDQKDRDEPAPSTSHSEESHWPHRIAGIARFTTAEDSRVGNRGDRDYSKVVTIKEGEAPPSGLFLVLEGRLRAWPSGKVIRCLDQGADRPPTCIAGASIDRVAFEKIDDRKVIAEWVK